MDLWVEMIEKRCITFSFFLFFFVITNTQAKTILLTPSDVDGKELTWSVEESVNLGLSWLESKQRNNGSFPAGNNDGDVGINSLCGIAFLASGSTPISGKYSNTVQGVLNYIIEQCDESGLISHPTSKVPMYGHGFSTLFLSEIYGMTKNDILVKHIIQKAVDLIVQTQNDDGGWRYAPKPEGADVSVTICQVMALRSARNAGIKVPKTTIDRAVSYIKLCQNPDGGFRYMISPGRSAFPRTAASVTTLFYAGVHRDESISRGLSYMIRNPNIKQHFYYGHYYAGLSTFLAGGNWWSTWWPHASKSILDTQNSDGSWTALSERGAYGTAMSLIVLQIPKRLLPILQR